jgi:hypothetical protein
MNWGVIFFTPVLRFFSCILYLIDSYKTIYEISMILQIRRRVLREIFVRNIHLHRLT